MSTEESKAIVKRFYEEVVGTGNADLLDAYLAEDVDDWHTPRMDLPAGIEGVRQRMVLFRGNLGEYKVTVDDLVAEGDRVVAFWTQTGIHQGPLFGFPATGKRVTFTAVSLLRLAEGKIIQYRARPDVFAVAEQIGLTTRP